jgi:putative protein-disulfide isomerase
MSQTVKFVYFADPMCSWCYGSSPVIAAIAERFEDRMPLQLVMGGLRAGNTVAMRPQDIRNAWTRVGAATGQELGIRGFPTLIAGSEEKGYALVTNGYRPLVDVLEPLERWWADAPVTASVQPGAPQRERRP